MSATKKVSPPVLAAPDRDRILELLHTHIYRNVINNSHRGDVVELMVLEALGDPWKLVSGGWHPWDLQRGAGQNRIRIQVKQTAAQQVWAKTKSQTLTLGWKKAPPRCFRRDNPHEEIENEGWFCDLFVIGVHSVAGDLVDQLDVSQWEFFVIQTQELAPAQKSISLRSLRERWKPVGWYDLHEEVEKKVCNRRQ